MVKKDSEVGFNSIRSVWNFDTFNKKKVSINSLLIYSSILIFLISVINVLNNNFTFVNSSSVQAFLYVLIGLPLIMIFLFSVFIVFLSSFEGKMNKSFLESLLVYSSITLPFLFLGNFLGLVRNFMIYGTLVEILGYLVLILVLYYYFNFIVNFKKYYGTTYSRIIVSLLLSYMFFIFLYLGEGLI